MISEELVLRVREQLPFAPNAGQSAAIAAFAEFMSRRGDNEVMVLTGSAGTGKTSLTGAVVRSLMALSIKTVLLTPTGRAAKVLSGISGHDAFTIHRKIYRQRAFTGDMTGFQLSDNLHADTLFIVDEASMVSDYTDGGSGFGSGMLLTDLVRFVYSGRNCRLMLIGDRAQLPPVGDEESPALSRDVLEGFGLSVTVADLSEVARQQSGSGILCNATMIRRMIEEEWCDGLPRLSLNGYRDIRRLPGNELVEQLEQSYWHEGRDETIVITRTNRLAIRYNNGIRSMVLERESPLEPGDMLMIVRNNYFWASEKECPMAFIANGDRAEVVRVRHERELYGLHFADVAMRFPDYDGYELTATVCLDSLSSESPSLTREQQERLFAELMEDYADIPRKADRMKKLKEDVYFNALQVKYAYAVTCHKAQGGQWRHVYIDQGYMTDDMLTPSYLHWLYTAITRAADTVYLVNWPETQTDGAS